MKEKPRHGVGDYVMEPTEDGRFRGIDMTEVFRDTSMEYTRGVRGPVQDARIKKAMAKRNRRRADARDHGRVGGKDRPGSDQTPEGMEPKQNDSDGRPGDIGDSAPEGERPSDGGETKQR